MREKQASHIILRGLICFKQQNPFEGTFLFSLGNLVLTKEIQVRYTNHEGYFRGHLLFLVSFSESTTKLSRSKGSRFETHMYLSKCKQTLKFVSKKGVHFRKLNICMLIELLRFHYTPLAQLEDFILRSSMHDEQDISMKN